MHKSAATLLVKQLSQPSNTHFAFAPNGNNPALWLDKVTFTADKFKQKAKSDLGITIREGEVFLGTLVKGVFQVDSARSVGEVQAQKAVRSLQKLASQVRTLGEKLPASLQRVQVKVDDGEVVDDVGSGLGAEGWDAALDELEQELERANLREDAEAATAVLTRIRALRDDIKLSNPDFSDTRSDVQDSPFKALRLRIDGLLRTADPSRAAAREAWGDQRIASIAQPDGLADTEKYIRPQLEAFNRVLSGEDGVVDDHTAQRAAEDLAQACADRLRTLKGRFFQDKAKISAIRLIQRQAEEAVARLAAVREMRRLHTAGNIKVSDVGVNKALFVKDEADEVRFVVKGVGSLPQQPTEKERAEREKRVREMGTEVASSEVADRLSDLFGFPQMVASTRPVVLQTPDGPLVASSQVGWKGAKEVQDAEVLLYDIPDHGRVSLTIGQAERIMTLEGEARTLELRKCLPDLPQEREAGLLQRLGKGRSFSDRRGLLDLGVAPDDLAEDIAATAIVDILTGQSDHAMGKTDNLLIADTPEGRRMRPIDFGRAMLDPSDPESRLFDYRAWAPLSGAARPLPEALLKQLRSLDPDELPDLALDASRRAAATTGEPGMILSDGAVKLLRLQGHLLKLAVETARRAGVTLAPRDLATFFHSVARPVLTGLDEGEDLPSADDPVFAKKANEWVKNALLDGAVHKERASVEKWMSSMRAGLEKAEQGQPSPLIVQKLREAITALEERLKGLEKTHRIAKPARSIEADGINAELEILAGYGLRINALAG